MDELGELAAYIRGFRDATYHVNRPIPCPYEVEQVLRGTGISAEDARILLRDNHSARN